MKLFVIILHFGNSQITKECIKSISQNEKGFEEIVVVDNNKNFKFQISKIKNQKMRIIKTRENLGYAGGMNVGIKYALAKEATHILVLNNDIIFEKEILSQLIKFLETKKESGIVSPAIKFVRNGRTVYDLGGKVNMIFGRTSHFEVNKDEMLKQVQHDNVLEVDYVSGCCMLIKTRVFKKIGLFDEKFFLYYEDVDFCLRAKKENFNTYVLPSAFIFHKLSESVGKISEVAISNQIKSALIFGRKHIKILLLNKFFIFYQCSIFLFKNLNNGKIAFKSFYLFYKEGQITS